MAVKEFIKLAFSDNGNPSSSRILGAISALVSCASLLYLVIHTGKAPEATATLALSGFGTAHYIANRASTVVDNATSNVVKSKSDADAQAVKDTNNSK